MVNVETNDNRSIRPLEEDSEQRTMMSREGTKAYSLFFDRHFPPGSDLRATAGVSWRVTESAACCHKFKMHDHNLRKVRKSCVLSALQLPASGVEFEPFVEDDDKPVVGVIEVQGS